VADPVLYEKAASCYYEARLVGHAVRCYRLAGAHRRAADLNASLGDYREAAVDYERADLPELAAWLLVHRVCDPDAAVAVLTRLAAVPVAPSDGPGPADASAPAGPSLRHRLVLTRCAVASGAPPAAILPVIDATCAELADPGIPHDRFSEEWAVALAEHVQRYDQVALVFAASVRGRRYGAAQRWSQWAARVLQAELIIPAVPEPARVPVRG
jgi:hypothetical protein